jgi:hypothetical protein
MYKQQITNVISNTSLAYIEDNGWDLVAVYYSPDDEFPHFSEFGEFNPGEDEEDFLFWDPDNQTGEMNE